MAYNFFKRTYISGLGGPNQVNCDQFWYDLKTFLLANGWSAVRTSDGTTVSSVGTDNITTAASGTGGLNNQNAWFILQAPAYNGVSRQMLFYKYLNSNTNNQFRHIAYSMQGFSTTTGMTGSAISAANPPLAFDGILPLMYTAYNNVSPYTAMTSSALTFSLDTPSNFFDFQKYASTNYGVPSLANDRNVFHYMISADATTGGWLAYIYDNYMRPIYLFGYDPLSEYDSQDPDPVAIITYCAYYAMYDSTNQICYATNSFQPNHWFAGTWFRRPATFSSLADTQYSGGYNQTYRYNQNIYCSCKPLVTNINTNSDAQYANYNSQIPPLNYGIPDSMAAKSSLLFPSYYMVDPVVENSSARSFMKGRSQLLKIPLNGNNGNRTLSTPGNIRDIFVIANPSSGWVQSGKGIIAIPWDGTVPLTT